MKTPRTTEQLIANYKQLSRRLADETISDVEAEAVRVELAKVRAEIDSK